MTSLTQERLKHLLEYDPEDGVFTRRVACRPCCRAGDEAGYMHKGYRRVTIDGSAYLVHRLAFLWMTGEWPTGHVDHRDGNKLNNKWSNLRPATWTQNQGNKPVRLDSTSGLKGVAWRPRIQKWVAYIGSNKQRVHLGVFTSKEDAHDAYVKAAQIRFGEYARSA
jgi:hypothetical protein